MSRRKWLGGPEALTRLYAKASLLGRAARVAALAAILVAATVALGENRTYAQSATGASMQTVAPDGGAAEAAAALERLARANYSRSSGGMHATFACYALGSPLLGVYGFAFPRRISNRLTSLRRPCMRY